MKNKRLWVAIIAILLVAAMLIPLLVEVFSTHAHAAPSSSEIREEINQMEKDNEKLQAELNALKEQVNKNATDITNMMANKANLEGQYNLLHAQVKNLNEQIAAYNLLIAQKQEDVTKAEKHLKELNELHKFRIRAMEEDGNLSYWSVIFEAKSFSELLDRLSLIEEIAASDRKRLNDMRQAAKELEEAKTVLQQERASLKETKDTLAARQEEMLQKAAEAQQILENLIAKGEEFNEYMEEAEDRISKLEQEIANKEVEFDEAKKKEYEESLGKPVVTPPPQPNYGGGIGGTLHTDSKGITWMVPASYTRVSSKFDPNRLHPTYGYRRPHNGVDLAAPCPTPILATRAGIVSFVCHDRYSDAGYYIQIDHMDGYKSVYMHMCCDPTFKIGDVVSQGQVIGCIGTTGASTGNHLHFGISYNGVYEDPLLHIG